MAPLRRAALSASPYYHAALYFKCNKIAFLGPKMPIQYFVGSVVDKGTWAPDPQSSRQDNHMFEMY